MTSPIGKSRQDQMEPADGSPEDERLMPEEERPVPEEERPVPEDERPVPDAGATVPGEGELVPDEERIVLADDPDDDPVILDDDRIVPGQGDAATAGSPGQAAVGTVGRDAQEAGADDMAAGADDMPAGTLVTAPAGPQPAAAAARTSARGAAESTSLSAQWPEILAMFVDDPRASVEMAAGLTDDSVEALIGSVKQRQHALLSAWQGTDAGTEDLRTTLQAYRTFWNHVDAFAQDA
jgi:hypothetical protein